MNRHSLSWHLRTWGAGFLVIAYNTGILLWNDRWFTRIGALALSLVILFDAQRRGTTQYLHGWLFFLLGLLGVSLFTEPLHIALTVTILIAAGVANLLVAPYTVGEHRPSRWHFVAAILFAQTLLLSSLLRGTPALQAALAVIPVLAVEELIHKPRSDWWRKVTPFAILTLLILFAILIRASFTLH